ncbi:MAG: DUF5723 family protein [Bacteroidales bacterium]|nr:DUF5723 family protein [Bacteroidales bacterium]
MRKILIIPVVFYFFILPFQSIGQADMTSHFMDALPQAHYENPALVPDLRFHFSFPGISSIYAEGYNSGFHFRDVIETRGDSSYLLLDELINEKLDDANSISLHYAHELFSLGFTANKKMYFSFAVSERFNFRFAYPKQLLGLPYNGNGAYLGETIEMKPLNLKTTHYRQYAVGFAWQQPEFWSAGLRVKLLYGKANAWTENAYASLYTAEDGYAIDAEAELLGHMTLPPGFDPDNTEDNQNIDPKEYLLNTANWGVGLDAGFRFMASDKLSVTGSVVDLGSIKFNRNSYTYENEKTKVTFEGFDAYDYVGMNDSLIEEDIQNTLDSIADKFNIQDKEGSYKMPLTTRFYLGGQYHLNDKNNLGLLFRGQFFGDAFRPALTASYRHRFGRFLSLSASYTAMPENLMNIGLGAAMNLGPFQLYVISDNWLAAIQPEQTKFFNVHVGLNIAARHKKAEKPMLIDY